MPSHPNSESSDEEGPEEESFATGKVEAQNARNLILEKQRKEKEELKLKRQKRQNLFVTQKQVKVARLEKQQKQLDELLGKIRTSSNDDEITPSSAAEITGMLPAQEINILPSPKNAPKKKFYKDFNIEVKTFKQLRNSRATEAIDFKARRLAKPHRENILTNKIHEEKLKAAGKF